MFDLFTLVDAGLAEGFLDQEGPWVMLGVFAVWGLLGRHFWTGVKVCPAVLSRAELSVCPASNLTPAGC